MQKWYNDGYFSSDLPMKRVRYDTDWTTVAVLVQQSNGENIFFSPSLIAPALGRGNDSPSQNLPAAEHVVNEPFQPAPIRSLRTSTLESYLNAGSLASDSPSSSFGASHFGNPSPDPTAFGGRENKSYVGGDLDGRIPEYALQNHGSIFGDRRPIGHEFPVNTLINNDYQTALQPQGPSFGMNFNGYAFNNSPVSQDTWTTSNIHASAFGNNREQGSERSFSSLNTQTSAHPCHQLPSCTEGNHQEPFPTIFNPDPIVNNDILGDHNGQTPEPTDLHPNYGHYDFSGQPFHSAQEVSPSRDLDEGGLRPGNTFGFRNVNVDTVASQSPRNISPALPAQSPWEALPDPSINQRSATVNAMPQPLANLDAQPIAPTSQHSPWHCVDQNSSPQVPNSLATRNLGQHQQQQEVSDAMNKLSLGSLVRERDILNPPDSAPTELTIPSPTRPSARNRQLSPDQPPSGDSAPVPVVQKVAWAKEEEGKRKKGSSIPSLNIREIQEAEVRKIESRKAAERQKDRSARATSAIDIKEDHQPFTTSWGLPTSQAGARGNIATREPLVATAQTPPPTHVWTTSLKQPIAKKTMKEIQEEETRKKLVAKEMTTPPLPKKAHTDTTKPATTLFTSSSNNAWTTVGPSGKTSAVLTSTLRTSAPTSSGSAVLAVPRASSSPVQKASPAPTLKTRPSANKPDTLNETPSHEFSKWLSDSLKGLNSSVNGM